MRLVTASIAVFCLLMAAAPVSGQTDAAETEARTLSSAGKHREALTRLDDAARAYLRTGNRAGQLRVELLRSAAYRVLTERDRARTAALRARRLAANLSDRALEAQALLRLIDLAEDRGETAEVERLLRAAVPLAEAAGESRTQITVFEKLGRLAFSRGQMNESLEYRTRVIEAAEKEGDVALLINGFAGRSVSHLVLGDSDRALADAQRGYELAGRAPDPRARATAIFGLAQVHLHVWSMARAGELLTEAIAAYEEAGYPRGVAFAKAHRMHTRRMLGDYVGAAADGKDAVALFAKAGSSGATAETLSELALVEARRGDHVAAAEYVRQTRALGRRAVGAQVVETNLGVVALEMNQPTEAMERFTAALNTARRLGNREYEWRGHHNSGEALLALGRPAEAQAHLEEAVEIVEWMRRALPEAGLRAAFLGERTGPYEALVDALMAQSRTADDVWAHRALEVAERGRGRSLADLLWESQARAADPRLTDIQARERAFSERLAGLQKRVIAVRSDRERAALLEELNEAESDYDALVVQIRRESPAYAALVHPEPLPASEIAALPRPDEALIEFVFTRRDGFAWAIRNGRVQSYRIGRRDAIESTVRLLQSLMKAGDVAGIRQTGAYLYEALLGPAGPLIADAERLVLIPAGPLNWLPFALLQTPGDRGTWLAEKYALAVAPSAGVLAELRRQHRRPAREPLLAFAAPVGAANGVRILNPGSPPAAMLAHAEAEARDIASLVGSRADRVVRPPLETEVKSAITGQYRVLHFAAHAVIDEIVPRRSAIVMTPSGDEDGLLQLNEIANLSVDADLVVLAACRSHVGPNVRGEGMLSLSRAFMRAGAGAVLASLWDVDDAETRRFMRFFYESLGGGAAPDDALRVAQRRMIRAGGRSANAENWAAFVISGDASRGIFTPPPQKPRLSLRFAVTAAALVLALALGAAAFRKRAVPVPLPD